MHDGPVTIGPPPPSPPASVNIENNDHDHDMPDYPAKPLHRALTDARLGPSQPSSPVAPGSPNPIPIPEPVSRLSHTTTIDTQNTTTPVLPPSRRHTTGSAVPKVHPRLYQRFAPPQSQQQHSHYHHLHHSHLQYQSHSHFAQDDSAIIGDAALALQSDIEIYEEQVRRERQSKRAKQQAQAEAEAALTRTDTRGTRGTKDDDDKPLVGNLIGEDHANYVLMYNMLTGIRIGVSRCQAKIKRPLTDEDFTARHKYSFDIVGNELTPSAKYDFKFKDYAPWVFRTLREDHFRIDPADYLLSLTAKYILSELGSPGKSGSFFYFSRDYRFIIKTIRHSEHKFLLSTLQKYFQHVQRNPHTLLSRFYGLHRVKLPRGRKIHFVIMNNLFPPHRDIHETYDLKGSTIGREYPEEKAKNSPKSVVLKDLNWINRGKILELGPEKRALFEEQARRDVEYLKSVNVMDYSLLVGIHSMKRGNRDNVRKNTLRVFEPELPQGPRSKQSARGTKTPEAIAMRRAMRSSDPRALSMASGATVVGGGGATTGGSSSTSGPAPGIQVPGGTLHAPTTLMGPSNTLTVSPSPTPHPTPSPPPYANPRRSGEISQQQKLQDDEEGAAEEEGGDLLFELDRNTILDRQYFIFYQDEGGLSATDEQNQPLGVNTRAARGGRRELTTDRDRDPSSQGGTIYYLGIIDILTPYGFVKRAEHYWKTCTLVFSSSGSGSGASGSGSGGGGGGGHRRKKISQVEPGEYGARFVEFMRAIVRGGEGGERFK